MKLKLFLTLLCISLCLNNTGAFSQNSDKDIFSLLDLNFKGRNIDNFVGSAKILNANLLHEKNRLTFDSLVLNTNNFENGLKTLSLSSNEFSLLISGKSYQILDLPATFQTYLSHYFPSYFVLPSYVPANQDFKVTLNTKEFNSYAKIIDKKLSGLDYALINGSINTNLNKFSFDANVPSLRFDKYLFTDGDTLPAGMSRTRTPERIMESYRNPIKKKKRKANKK